MRTAAWPSPKTGAGRELAVAELQRSLRPRVGGSDENRQDAADDDAPGATESVHTESACHAV